MTNPCIICVAITGSLPTKANNPAVPITIAEQVESTHEAFEAGATIAHCHVRDDDGKPTSDPDRFARLIARYLDEAVRLGEIEPVDVPVISLAWMGAIYALVIRWVTTGDPAPQQIVAALVPALLRSVGYLLFWPSLLLALTSAWGYLRKG